MRYSEHDLRVNGITLHYLRWLPDGPPRPPLVLHHATGFCARVLRAVAEPLAADYDVYAVDRRGHGRTDKPAPTMPPGPQGGYDFGAYLGDTSEYLDALGLRDVYAVGHSGGATELLMAAGERPDLVSRILAIEPIVPQHPPPPSPPGGNSMGEMTRRRKAVFESREAVRERFSARPPFARFQPGVLNDYVQYGFHDLPAGGVTLACPPDCEAVMYESSGVHDAAPSLRKVRCPVHILVGSDSGGGYRPMCEYAQTLIPQATLETVPHGTHFLPMEQPGLLVRKILAFAATA